MIYIKEQHPALFIDAFLGIFEGMWQNGLDVSKPDLLAEVLGKTFEQGAVAKIVQATRSAEVKEIRKTISWRSRLPRLVTSEWVSESWKEGTRLDEERRYPLPNLMIPG